MSERNAFLKAAFAACLVPAIGVGYNYLDTSYLPNRYGSTFSSASCVAYVSSIDRSLSVSNCIALTNEVLTHLGYDTIESFDDGVTARFETGNSGGRVLVRCVNRLGANVSFPVDIDISAFILPAKSKIAIRRVTAIKDVLNMRSDKADAKYSGYSVQYSAPNL